MSAGIVVSSESWSILSPFSLLAGFSPRFVHLRPHLLPVGWELEGGSHLLEVPVCFGLCGPLIPGYSLLRGLQETPDFSDAPRPIPVCILILKGSWLGPLTAPAKFFKLCCIIQSNNNHIITGISSEDIWFVVNVEKSVEMIASISFKHCITLIFLKCLYILHCLFSSLSGKHSGSYVSVTDGKTMAQGS